MLSCPAPTDLWIAGDLHRGDAADAGLAVLQSEVGRFFGPLVVNLEGPVADAPPPGQAVPLHNPARVLSWLAEGPVRAVGIDNNHTAGAEARAQTEAAVRKAGLVPLGDVPSLTGTGGPRVLQVDLGDPDTPGRLASLGSHPGVYDLVVLFHTAGPPSYLPTPELRAAVEQALAAGADVVAAHGTHALGPVERRGAAVIAWGLGNLVFNCPCTTETDGLLLHVDAGRAEVWPVRAGMMGAPARLAPDPDAVFDLLQAVGSSPLQRRGAWADL